MNFQLVLVFLIGLAASSFALDLSHANKRSVEVEPRLFDFVKDLYAQVIYPPVNHVVTNLALLGAQLLAGVAQNGLPAPGGRTLHLTEAEMRGFWDTIQQAASHVFNNVIKDPLEQAISGGALMLAQVLAGIGVNGINLGKRDLTEAEMRGFVDALESAMSHVFNNVIKGPLEQAISGGALMLAQVLAGVGVNGVDLSSLIGKRDLTEAEMRGFTDALESAMTSVFNNVIKGPLEQAISGGALMLAQVLAGIGVNGVDLSSFLGKRDLTEAEMRGFTDALESAMTSVFNNVIKGPLEQAISGGALMLAQVLAGIGVNGVDLSSFLG